MFRGTALILEGICAHCEIPLTPEGDRGRCKCCHLIQSASAATGNYSIGGIANLSCPHFFPPGWNQEPVDA